MLFNSIEFIVGFLPIIILIYLSLEHIRHAITNILWLFIASLFFYAYWNWYYLFLLIASLLINFAFAEHIALRQSRLLTVIGISFNLFLLAYFKYTNFFLENINHFTQFSIPHIEIILPLGISFFTFQQIAFLADVYAKKVQPDRFLHYGLFISFFPQLIAGPIVHYQEIVPQMGKIRDRATIQQDLQIGLTIFLIGLFKKYALADSLAGYSSATFAQAETLTPIENLVAWKAMFAYAFQIYFDFSGYSDMAIGLGRIFGFKLPLNFFSPYKSLNISEFWRRWHITLSRFLRDYLYIPLGGNRYGTVRTSIHLLVVMLLGGLWHGAGWNFMIWGLLHGCYLLIFHAFQAVKFRFFYFTKHIGALSPLFTVSSWLITFLAVCFAWIFFRAATWQGAINIISALIDFSNFTWQYQSDIDFYLLSAFSIVLFMPTTWQIMQIYQPTITLPPDKVVQRQILTWKFNYRWAIIGGFLMAVIILKMIQGQPTEFIYFQF